MIRVAATLVDTPIWVTFLRPIKAPRLRGVIANLAEADLVWTSKIIVAELMGGCKDQKTASALERDFAGFRSCPDTPVLFRQAAFVQLGVRRHRPSQRVCGLVDAYLASLAARENLRVLTADKAMAFACAFLRVPGSLYGQADEKFEQFSRRAR